MQLASFRHDVAAARSAGVKIGEATEDALYTFGILKQHEDALRAQIELEIKHPDIARLFRGLSEFLKQYPGVTGTVRPIGEAAE